MTAPRERSPSAGRPGGWLAWLLVSALVVGGVYLAFRYARTTPAAVETRP